MIEQEQVDEEIKEYEIDEDSDLEEEESEVEREFVEDLDLEESEEELEDVGTGGK